MNKKMRYLFAFFAVLLIVFSFGCAEENETGNSQLSDFCDGAVTVYNVPNSNEPEVTLDSFDAFVVKPNKECGVLPTLYCVFTDIYNGGGQSCVVLEQ